MSVSSLSFTDPEDFDVLSESPLSSPDTPAIVTMSLNDNITPVSLSPPVVWVGRSRTPAAEQEVQSIQSLQTGSGQTYEKHPRFYFDDGNVTFLVGDTLYRVHRYFFQRDSTHFANLLLGHPLSEATDASGPIALDDVECNEFDALLSILYPVDFHECEVKTVDAWTAILRLSTKWSFASIRKLAIARLEPIASAVDKVVLGRTYTIDAWLRPGFVALCERAQPLTRDEGRRLGVDDVILCVTVRESMRARRPGVSRSEVEGLVDSHLDPVQHAAPANKADEVVKAVAGASPKLAPPSFNSLRTQPAQNSGRAKPAPPSDPWKRQMPWDKKTSAFGGFVSLAYPNSPLPVHTVEPSPTSPPGPSPLSNSTPIEGHDNY
ncbi:hypothetical protein DENSPDRAFT_702354 [Dentipellis sp. KUC8613]|nr:hypothetical protein DENSPDRAFT_702354 [Dentipellis sp. KUC8613]